jgi:NADPH:quinone reductase-like Zn-dependent oxidoreductase
MLGVRLLGLGGPEQLEVREDLPVPKPAAGEVLVRVGAAAVNNTDINTRTGWYSRAARPGDAASPLPTNAGTAVQDSAWTGAAFQFPRIQGADACGRIVAVGAGVVAARVGERVLVDPVLRGGAGAPAAADPVGYLGADRDGAFAQFMSVPAANAHVVHSSLGDVELASFPCSSLAAENMLSRAAVGRGDVVLITGASGGVGTAAIQLALRRGARVIAIAEAAKSPALQALGANRVLPRDTDLLATLGQESVDVVIDCVGGAQFPHFARLLKHAGRYAVAGAIGGAIVELDLRLLYLKDLTLLGCTIPEPGLFGQLLAYIERGEIRPLVSATYALRDIHRAQEQFLRKAHIGKIVLVP